jgi:hypothetical protein
MPCEIGNELGVAGKTYRRVGVWAYRRLRHAYSDQEVPTKLMRLCKRRHANTFDLASGKYMLFPGQDTR